MANYSLLALLPDEESPDKQNEHNDDEHDESIHNYSFRSARYATNSVVPADLPRNETGGHLPPK